MTTTPDRHPAAGAWYHDAVIYEVHVRAFADSNGDGIGDLVSLGGFGSLERNVYLAYRILQGARLRTSWTEFISCPSCGRTLFDLEKTTARVKERTAHLAGLASEIGFAPAQTLSGTMNGSR